MKTMAPPWHQEAWDRLRARRERGAMPHALLLAGPAGLGKRAFLDRLVRGLLCQQPVGGDACGQCRTCKLVDAGTHPDRIDITFELNTSGKPRKEIVVGQMRNLSSRLAMASQLGGWQVASIDPADAMNAAAANALLKTLEEPSGASLIVLVADAPWRLTATIRSRCQRIDFRVPPATQALPWLENAGVADAGAALEAAGGNPGLAHAWAGQGMLDERRQVQSDLAALAQGRGDVYTVMKRWVDGEVLAQRLWFAAQMAAMDARARATGSSELLGSRLDDEALGHWFERANRAREALRGPLRPDLLVLDLLTHWC
ncbi:MAG TPA: DNA polymerase III subunit delta' [Oleiagrimonas sp.]|nr:DNA polymerase III subunit delta' [Oleiagrimonas sp.]